MKKKFADYLAAIDLSQQAFVSRVEYALTRIETVAGEPVEDFLVEDLITQEGARSYLHLVAFTKAYVVAMDDFTTENAVTVFPYATVHELEVATTDYEFKDPTTTSRIVVEFTLGSHEGWNLQGTRENCDAIWAAVKKRLRPLMTA